MSLFFELTNSVIYQKDADIILLSVKKDMGIIMFSKHMQIKYQYQHYSTIVDVPEYQDPCALQVHFLACQQVKVTATCHGISHPEHPFKSLFDQKEPDVCPQ
ncbi:DUF3304 domain-containing protein [Xenorhabdus szentirmaii]|uniref:Uncharacterized protein n=2 Tax=Xenorhabdus szentirmaii TaxID=290112 RepID=W1IY32_9GAMM|nr:MULTISPECIES: DUF3304 domain-containing protein [Xenorhabdus]CDL82743.1 hypothetical protein XSR1_230050 [Xenorhabdus szentirmaii DSM 16338]